MCADWPSGTLQGRDKGDDLTDSAMAPFWGGEAESENTQNQEETVLVFSVGAETYGISVENIVEVLRQATVTQLPQMPHFLHGIIRIRGQAVPLVDLRARFGLDGPCEAGRPILVVRTLSGATGFLVDRIEGLKTVDENDLQPVPSNIPQVGKNCISKFAADSEDADRYVLILDVEKLFDSKERQHLLDMKLS